jgi:hypothetical protein
MKVSLMTHLLDYFLKYVMKVSPMTRLSGIDPQTRHESLSHDAFAWIIFSNTS